MAVQYLLGASLSVRAPMMSTIEKNHWSSCQVRRICFAANTIILPWESAGNSSLMELLLSSEKRGSSSAHLTDHRFRGADHTLESNARPCQRPVDLRHRLQAGRVLAGFDAADRLLANAG